MSLRSLTLHWRQQSRRRKWLYAASAFVLVGGIALSVAAWIASQRLEPRLRAEAIRYLENRFDSEVEIGSLRVSVSPLAPLKALLFLGQESLASVSGEDIEVRHQGRTDIAPLLVLKSFTASVDAGPLLNSPRTIHQVTLDGMEINIPPRDEDNSAATSAQAEPGQDQTTKQDGDGSSVIVEEVLIRDADLNILPKESHKVPLHFDLHDIRLTSAGKDVQMQYDAILTNPKPPGEIDANGTFGPWNAGDPGRTPLSGDFVFADADLGIFDGIAGILHSTGSFSGTLSEITAQGEATVPDFRLKRAGNPIQLTTQYEVHVDGTNGNTELRPVHAVLGTTEFTTAGFVVEHDGDDGKTIDLKATMPAGNLQDVLTLAMEGEPIMEGTLRLDTLIKIPPSNAKVKQKLMLEGDFEISEGRFHELKVQQKVDELSQRGQGEPGNQQVDDVFHQMSGAYTMSDGTLTFHSLAFAIPGADVSIGGDYNMDAGQLDFHGALMLDAHLSETMTGWKSWALKPLDPFFSERGAGTFLHIKVTGDAKDPQFGLDPGGTSPIEEAEKEAEDR